MKASHTPTKIKKMNMVREKTILHHFLWHFVPNLFDDELFIGLEFQLILWWRVLLEKVYVWDIIYIALWRIWMNDFKHFVLVFLVGPSTVAFFKKLTRCGRIKAYALSLLPLTCGVCHMCYSQQPFLLPFSRISYHLSLLYAPKPDHVHLFRFW